MPIMPQSGRNTVNIFVYFVISVHIHMYVCKQTGVLSTEPLSFRWQGCTVKFRIKFKISIFVNSYLCLWCFPGGTVVKNLPAKQETWVRSLGQEDPLEKGMATHSSILAWRIP